MLDKIIKNVLELPGVEGACLLDKKGVILLNALPEFFLEDFLDDLSRRIIALYEAVDENYVPCDDYLLKYPQKYIQLRRSRNAYLLVAVDPGVNLVSLRMVTNLVLKHITPKALASLRASLADTAESTQSTAEAKAAPASPPDSAASGPSASTPSQSASAETSPPEAQASSEAVSPVPAETPAGETTSSEQPKRYRFYRGVKYEY